MSGPFWRGGMFPLLGKTHLSGHDFIREQNNLYTHVVIMSSACSEKVQCVEGEIGKRPRLTQRRLMYERDVSFAQEIRQSVEGKRIDVEGKEVKAWK